MKQSLPDNMACRPIQPTSRATLVGGYRPLLRPLHATCYLLATGTVRANHDRWRMGPPQDAFADKFLHGRDFA